MKKAFQIAGPLTRGLPLRTVIEYTLSEMRFLNGFEPFIRALHEQNIFFVINSTGYGITAEVIKAVYGPQYFYHVICNRLVFENHGKRVEEAELDQRNQNSERGHKFPASRQHQGLNCNCILDYITLANFRIEYLRLKIL